MLRPCSSLAHYFSETWYLWQASNQIPRLKTLISRSIHAQKKKKKSFSKTPFCVITVLSRISPSYSNTRSFEGDHLLQEQRHIGSNQTSRVDSPKPAFEFLLSPWIFNVQKIISQISNQKIQCVKNMDSQLPIRAMKHQLLGFSFGWQYGNVVVHSRHCDDCTRS